MPNTWFQFKQFRIEQDAAAHKVGTDGVLLGAWTKHKDPKQILDIGTGTALIALMLAQRFPESKISAIDLNKESILQAQANVTNSNFNKSISCQEQDVLFMNEETMFDLIVSNPPFFKAGIESKSSREIARHQKENFIQELFKKSWNMLHDNGSLAMILPLYEAEDLMEYDKYLSHKTTVKNKQSAEAKRVLLQWKKTSLMQKLQPTELCIRNEDNSYHKEYVALCKDFYL